MSLDFHVGKSEHEASGKPSRLQMDRIAHQGFSWKHLRASYPSLARIEYHTDTVFSGEELQKLGAEARQAVLGFDHRTEQFSLLSRLIEICEEAQRDRVSVFVFAD